MAKKKETVQKAFAFGCSIEIFPADEQAALSEKGNRLEALAARNVHAADSGDEHFLLVDRDEADPETLLERAWLRLKARREIEREQKKKTTPPPPQNYGMTEFDADRCWW
jgi:uncharacterized protein YifE (UPF0438 family)